MAPTLFVCAALLLLISILTLAQSVIYRVDSENDCNPCDGLSWPQALPQLSDAFNRASFNDEVWIRGNRTYYPSTTGSTSDVRLNCFTIDNGVRVYGGFRGRETLLSERPINQKELFLSVISGNIGNPFVREDNCYHVITYNQDVFLDRVVIIDGFADLELHLAENTQALHSYGAALITDDIFSPSDVRLNEVIFADNVALNGGALWFGGTYLPSSRVNVRITESLFEFNAAIDGKFEGGYGAAIYAYYGANISVTSTRFMQNDAEFRGGAVYLDYGAAFSCDDCLFERNQARGYGGAVFAENRQSTQLTTVSLTGSDFVNNTAMAVGGALCFYNGVTAAMSFVSFQENSANFGGAVSAINAQMTAVANTFSNNVAFIDANTRDEYIEEEFLFHSVDSELSLDILAELDTIYSLYTRKGSEIDLFPFDATDPLCFVDGDNLNLNGDGLSWSTAKVDVQSCLDQIRTSGGEIWIKSGSYVPSQIPAGKGSANGHVDKSFTLYSNIRMYGGFGGTETERTQRDFSSFPTRLTGDLTLDGFTGRVNQIFFAQNAVDVVIDGFVIENAGCWDENDPAAGAGIFAMQSNLNIVNTIFTTLCGNPVGGGIFCQGPSTSAMINSAFMGNRAVLNGGAIYAENQCDFFSKWCTFDTNSASKKGGAVFLNTDSDAYFESAHFRYNYALDSGGCVAGEEESNATFYCSRFYNNSARWEGGCLYSGVGTFIQSATTREEGQGFIIYSNLQSFQSNYLENMGSIDRGQHKIYLWPYTYAELYNESCGAPCFPHCTTSAPSPTAPPTVPILECERSRSGLFRGVGVVFQFDLTFDSRVIIQTCLSEVDTTVQLYNLRTGLIAEDSDSCTDSAVPPNGQIDMNLVASTYYIQLSSESAADKNDEHKNARRSIHE